MRSIDMKRFIDCSADVFELQGRCLKEDEGSVPCRVRVGYRRILKEYVRPDQLKLTLWREHGGEVTYSCDLPVPTKWDGGVLCVDAVELVEKYCGKVHEDDFCCTPCWLWDRDKPCSATVLTAPRGVAQSMDLLGTKDWNRLWLASGTLTVDGRDIRSIGWICGSANCETLRELIEWVFGNAHSVSGEEIKKAVSECELIGNCNLQSLKVLTDRGSYELALFGDYIRVKLTHEPETVNGFQLARSCSAPDQIGILLRLMGAGSGDEIRSMLTEFKAQGLVRQF